MEASTLRFNRKGKNYEAVMERKRLEIEEKKKQRKLQRLRELSRD